MLRVVLCPPPTGEASEEELKERQAKAMADPDVQNILMDPIMRQVSVWGGGGGRQGMKKESGGVRVVSLHWGGVG